MHSSFVSGFTEFVPPSFIAAEAPMYKKSLVPGIAASMPDEEVLRMYAVSRFMLHPWIANIQVSWVKQGPGWRSAASKLERMTSAAPS